jgi:CubicO group peptidase (beta-lactamase class C family)
MTIHDLSSFQGLRARVAELMTEHRVPGVAVGILRDGAFHAEGFGTTSVEHGLPVTTETLFQIGSTTKTVCATVVMRLAEQGKLDVDAPVRRYLPGFRLRDEGVAARVTLRHCLQHTGGWAGDYFLNTGEGDDALEKYVSGIESLPQLTPLGEIWHYNNAGFGILGRVVEVVTGKCFEDVATELVLKPLEMTKTNFYPWDAMLERFAVGHHLDEHKTVRMSRPWALSRNTSSIGRINSSVVDQLRYAAFHLSSGGDLLSQASMTAMQTPTVRAANGDGFGLSWFIRDATGTRVIRHGGATVGQISAFWFVPALQFACTILTNCQSGGLLNNALSNFIREGYLHLEEPEVTAIDFTADLEPLLGDYREDNFGTVLHLSRDGDDLILRVTLGDYSSITSVVEPTPPPARFAFIAPDAVRVLEGDSKDARMEFLRDASGRQWVRASGRVYRRV